MSKMYRGTLILLSYIKQTIFIGGVYICFSLFLFTNTILADSSKRSALDIEAGNGLKLHVVATSHLNPNEGFLPSPVIIRLHELKSNELFNKANFIELYERDKEILGNDLVDSHSMRYIEPDEKRDTYFVLHENTNYISLFAEFFRYKNSKYKAIFPIVHYEVITR